MRMIRIGSFVFIGFLLVGLQSFAGDQGVSFEMKTNKQQYYEFEYIYLKYVVKNGRPQNVQPPKIEGGRVVDSGVEQTGGGMSITFNGQNIQKSHQQQTFVITFAIQSDRTGRIDIPETTINIDGKQYTEKGFAVYVKPFKISDNLLGKDRFIRAEVSNYQPYVGEGLSITYMMFTKDAVSEETQMKTQQFINFGDFSVKSLGDFKASRVRIKGQNYYMVELQSHLITPLTAGKKKIPGFDVEYVTYQVVQDGFFGRKVAVDRKVSAPPVNINVKVLSNVPNDFSGLVGDFKLNVNVDKKEVGVNDALTIRYEIKGYGHFDGLQSFEVDLPESWEIFEPKRMNNTAPGNYGMHGSLTYEYVAIPRRAGDYQLPQPELVCFNPKKSEYYRILPDAQKIIVAGGKEGEESKTIVSSSTNKKEVALQNQDIRYIKTDFELLKNEEKEAWPTGIVTALLGVSLVHFGALLWPFILGVKTRRGQRKGNVYAGIMTKCKSLSNDDGVSALNSIASEYWKEIWGVPLSEQDAENILKRLNDSGVSNDKLEKVKSLLKQLSLAAYAKGAMQFDDLKNNMIETLEYLKDEV